jgi:hypothetical protein
VVNLPYNSIGPLCKGRDTALVELRQRLMGGGGKAVRLTACEAIHGLGGVGKTRLAVGYAWRHATNYDALLFVSVRSPADFRRPWADFTREESELSTKLNTLALFLVPFTPVTPSRILKKGLSEKLPQYYPFVLLQQRLFDVFSLFCGSSPARSLALLSFARIVRHSVGLIFVSDSVRPFIAGRLSRAPGPSPNQVW